jgi:NADH-quinone oxidoreductase subunit H
MVETAPLWSVLLLPPIVGGFAVAAAGADAALAARAAGRRVRPELTLPLREIARLLVQQRRVTLASDRLLWRLGPAVVFAAALLAALVIPLGGHSVADLSIGVVWFNAMEALVWAGLWMTGWGANSAYGLVGGYRFVAQGLAYELPHMFVLITAALGAESLQVGTIVAHQSSLWFAAWMPVAFVVYLLSALAMSFWGPFSQPLGRELAGGVQAELSGPDRLVLRAGQYLLLAASSAFAVPLFLGGGQGPLLPAWLWSVVKIAAVLALLVWARRRLPAVRMDRYEELAWVVLIPLSILQALAVAIVVVVR